ncbi:MAG: hypothetical protein FWG90_04625 [Oscillospiraceae bacterium]|nr:hypothetical protein [Oscillospiraceae bacterium]
MAVNTKKRNSTIALLTAGALAAGILCFAAVRHVEASGYEDAKLQVYGGNFEGGEKVVFNGSFHETNGEASLSDITATINQTARTALAQTSGDLALDSDEAAYLRGGDGDAGGTEDLGVDGAHGGLAGLIVNGDFSANDVLLVGGAGGNGANGHIQDNSGSAPNIITDGSKGGNGGSALMTVSGKSDIKELSLIPGEPGDDGNEDTLGPDTARGGKGGKGGDAGVSIGTYVAKASYTLNMDGVPDENVVISKLEFDLSELGDYMMLMVEGGTPFMMNRYTGDGGIVISHVPDVDELPFEGEDVREIALIVGGVNAGYSRSSIGNVFSRNITADCGSVFKVYNDGADLMAVRLTGPGGVGGGEELNEKYTVTVRGSNHNAPGGGEYSAGDKVIVNAGTRAQFTFGGWTSSDVDFSKDSEADTSDTVLTFTMPAKNVTVSAGWKLGNAIEGDDDGIEIIIEGLPPGVSIRLLKPGEDALDEADFNRFSDAFKDLPGMAGKMVYLVYDIRLTQDDGITPYVHPSGEPPLVLTITLIGNPLKGLSGILVLHEKDVGPPSELEIIPHTSYNPGTGTLVFDASDFSLYGVAANEQGRNGGTSEDTSTATPPRRDHNAPIGGAPGPIPKINSQAELQTIFEDSEDIAPMASIVGNESAIG